MPFERLLFSPCLLPGVTRFQENQTVVEITPQNKETILFFCIDSNSKGHSNCANCRLRTDLWGTQPGQPICDLLVFYAKDDRRVLCFVELKDNKSDLKHAVEQVTNTYNGIKRKLKFINNYTIQAFLIGYTGKIPLNYKHDQKILEQHFGKNNYIYSAKNSDFADFIRGNLGGPAKRLTGKKNKRLENKKSRQRGSR